MILTAVRMNLIRARFDREFWFDLRRPDGCSPHLPLNGAY